MAPNWRAEAYISGNVMYVMQSRVSIEAIPSLSGYKYLLQEDNSLLVTSTPIALPLLMQK